MVAILEVFLGRYVSLFCFYCVETIIIIPFDVKKYIYHDIKISRYIFFLSFWSSSSSFFFLTTPFVSPSVTLILYFNFFWDYGYTHLSTFIVYLSICVKSEQESLYQH